MTPNTGPVPLRRAFNPTPPYLFGTALAPVVNTEFIFPSTFKRPNFGPVVLRRQMNPVQPFFPFTADQPDRFFIPNNFQRTGIQRTGPTALRGMLVARPIWTEVLPNVTFIYPTYSGLRATKPVGLNKRQPVFLWALVPPSFPAQFAGLRYFSGTVKELSLVATVDGNGGMRIVKNGVTYSVYLVDVADPNASGVRVQTPAGVKSVRLKT